MPWRNSQAMARAAERMAYASEADAADLADMRDEDLVERRAAVRLP